MRKKCANDWLHFCFLNHDEHLVGSNFFYILVVWIWGGKLEMISRRKMLKSLKTDYPIFYLGMFLLKLKTFFFSWVRTWKWKMPNKCLPRRVLSHLSVPLKVSMVPQKLHLDWNREHSNPIKNWNLGLDLDLYKRIRFSLFCIQLQKWIDFCIGESNQITYLAIG